jgi:TonB family protein
MKNLTLPLIVLTLVVLGCSAFRKNIDSNAGPANSATQRTETVETPATRDNTDPEKDSTADGVLNDEPISLPQPVYPPAARAVRAVGSVTVEIQVDVKGNVVEGKAVSGHPLLRAAAVAAARQAKFKPSSAPVTGSLKYEFKMD